MEGMMRGKMRAVVNESVAEGIGGGELKK